MLTHLLGCAPVLLVAYPGSQHFSAPGILVLQASDNHMFLFLINIGLHHRNYNFPHLYLVTEKVIPFG